MKYITNKDFKEQAKQNQNARARLKKALQALVTPLEDRQAKFVLSTAAVDREFDSIDPQGIDFRHYQTNPVVLFQHDHNLPIGRCVSSGVEGDKLVGVVEFYEPSIPHFGQLADGVWHLVKDGGLSAVSIGFLTTSWEFAQEPDRYENAGTDIRGAELLEFSVVTIPCNREALVLDVARETVAQKLEELVEVEEAPVADEAKGQRARKLKHLRRFLASID